MKKNLLLFSFIFSIFIFTACTTNRIEHNTNPVYVTNTNPMYILKPQSMEGIIDSYQLLNGSFGETNFTFLCYIQCDDKGINISLFNDFGTDMGYLFYDGNIVQFQSAVFPENLKAEYIILDIQNAYYSESELKEAYKAAGLSFEAQKTENSEVRIIKSGKKIIEMITKNGNSIKIQNSLRGYEYNLIEGEE